MRREFRFPRSTIFLMSLCLLGTFIAIDMARDVVPDRSLALEALALPALLTMLLRMAWGFLMMFVVGAVIYLVLSALKQSGVQRFSDMQTWPDQK